MPTYEYRCTQCGNEFDLFQRMSDPPRAECARCGGSAERKLSAGAGLLFKGSGFYITDYRSESYKKAAGSEGGSGGEKPKTDKPSSESGKVGGASTGGTTGGSTGGASSSGSE